LGDTTERRTLPQYRQLSYHFFFIHDGPIFEISNLQISNPFPPLALLESDIPVHLPSPIFHLRLLPAVELSYMRRPFVKSIQSPNPQKLNLISSAERTFSFVSQLGIRIKRAHLLLPPPRRFNHIITYEYVDMFS
jgi:hypothetical protein